MRVYILSFFCIAGILSLLTFLDYYFSIHNISFSSNDEGSSDVIETDESELIYSSLVSPSSSSSPLSSVTPSLAATPLSPVVIISSALPSENPSIPSSSSSSSPPLLVPVIGSLEEKIVSAFQNQSVLGVYATPSHSASFLFGKFPLNEKEHSVSLQTTLFNKKAESISNALPEEYLKIYEINTNGIDKDIAYKEIKNRIELQLENNIEANIVDVTQYGEKSFVIRLEPNQKTMYLVMDSGSRLLGIEYPLGENFSRHRILDKVLLELFPVL